MSLSNLLAQAHPQLEARLKEHVSTPCILFFSLTDGQTRARIVRGAGVSFQQAWQDGVVRCQREAQRHNLVVRWLRIDRVIETQAITWGELTTRLGVIKRNYFRLGLALDADLKHAFLEQELNANAMLYLGSSNVEAGINQKNFTIYAQRRFGKEVPLDFSAHRPVHVFTHEGLFLTEDDALRSLPTGCEPVWLPAPNRTNIRWRDTSALNAGRRQIETLDKAQVYALIDSSANFLARQVKNNGQFIYGHFPCFGREIPTYNSLRHASSVYSMLEAWELTRNDALLAAIRQALGYLTDTLIRSYPQDDGTTLAYNVDVSDEIKLGANAVSVLALVKYDELTGDTSYRPLMEALALGIARMQDLDTGRFVHVLNAEDLSLKEAFRIVYYDGEAAFGLMRLYGLTLDQRWLTIVEKAFDYFISADHWKHHDHWLSYCANELTLHKPKEKYFRFGVQNVAGYLDFILTRETTYPTLLELSMAFEAMLRRIEGEHPEMRHVLDGLDIEKFHRALRHRAHYLLNGFFWPELAMYFAKPSSVMGSFFIRHHTFRVRIDDVEHYLSGYVAYWKMLQRGRRPQTDPRKTLNAVAATDIASESVAEGAQRFADEFPPAKRPFVANWNGTMLAAAMRGKWQVAHGMRWRATGVCIATSAYLPGNVVIVRIDSATSPIGMSAVALSALPFQPQGVIVEDAGVHAVQKVYHGPLLAVPDMAQALLQLGRYSRQRFSGKVIGITGSAGKTTMCAMLACALQPWGKVGVSRLSANTSRGISWNLASIPWNSRFMVLEMAIAGMERSSNLVRPDVAVVSNVAPAHLLYHTSTENIAQKKSAIFTGMRPGGYAVLNADMLHADVFIQAARRRGLNVVTYGESRSATVRLIDFDDGAGIAVMQIADHKYELAMAGLTRHMLDNALACAGVASVLGLDVARAVYQLGTFKPLPGRGARFTIRVDERNIRIIDESYNANPLSMQAALRYFSQVTSAGMGVLLLGDMLELDVQTSRLHRELVPHIVQTEPRLVILVGEHMKAVLNVLQQHGLSARWFSNAEFAWADIKHTLHDNEVLMVKGSNSTGLHTLVRQLEDIHDTALPL